MSIETYSHESNVGSFTLYDLKKKKKEYYRKFFVDFRGDFWEKINESKKQSDT